ncbi:hypothetical protein J19TS2_11350 [Cohnella xylanilytica]|uniref:hypothetical protein n=1 Tax=Cohnella xylanilytica TaxID=557555 RepID=UPI001B019789|nr:hypothetical protein [Cohnella xylanilytica]GIO11580.1 hypothetical protein J19TS2_11350 [Cohnella xylanilytica]
MNPSQTSEWFETLVAELDDRLRLKGYEKKRHQSLPQSTGAGNGYAVFENATGIVRFIWDERERAFILRVYRKRTFAMNTFLLALRGKHDPEKLAKEWKLTGEEAERSTIEEAVRQIAETVAES